MQVSDTVSHKVPTHATYLSVARLGLFGQVITVFNASSDHVQILKRF